VFKNILIPQDGSKHSRAALTYGIWLAKKFDAKIIGLYVVDVVAMEGPFLHDLSGSLGFEPFLNFSTKMREILENKGQGILKEFAEICEREKIIYDSIQDFWDSYKCNMREGKNSRYCNNGPQGYQYTV